MQNITSFNIKSFNTNAQNEARLALREASYNGADFGVEYSDLRLDNTGINMPVFVKTTGKY
jgi:hypothetical protein